MNEHQNNLAAWLVDRPGIDARLARNEVAAIIALTAEINQVTREISTLVRTTPQQNAAWNRSYEVSLGGPEHA